MKKGTGNREQGTGKKHLNLFFLVKLFLIFFYFLTVSNVFAQLRSFNNIFPNLSEEKRAAAFTEKGLISYNQKVKGINLLANESSGINKQITSVITNKNPGYVIESIKVIPLKTDNLKTLDIYNALGNVRSLKGRLYDSYSKGQPTPLFEDATRIAGEKNTSSVNDPPPSGKLPAHETIYIKLKDVNFGNTYYRADITPVQNGLRYTLTNIRNISYLFVMVIKQEQFTSQLYIEPVQEGLLIYSIAGVDISDFAASRINVESAIAKRLSVINEWAFDEIKKVIR